jgi:hypothetical protein
MKNIIDYAKAEITGFEDLRYKFERDIILKGKTPKTYQCYILHIAHVSLYFRKLPIEVSDEQIADYLFKVKKENNYSESHFKFSVYGLRYLFRLYKQEHRVVNLPSLPKKKSLPVILSSRECKKLFAAPKKFRDKFMIALGFTKK